MKVGVRDGLWWYCRGNSQLKGFEWWKVMGSQGRLKWEGKELGGSSLERVVGRVCVGESFCGELTQGVLGVVFGWL